MSTPGNEVGRVHLGFALILLVLVILTVLAVKATDPSWPEPRKEQAK